MDTHPAQQLTLPEGAGPADDRQEHGDHHQEQGVLFAVASPAGAGGPQLRTWRSRALPARRQGALFGVEELGAGAEAWAAVATSTRVRRCEVCGRPLRSLESRAAGVGPGCAAKRGRAVVSSARLARVTRRRRHLAAVPAA
ncbi:hypothetical protein F0L17_26590 [Streptomyces sp. TRM43335]|uniref:Uncharacterized protein n=1 Tax=Streptomyces taklimakanensis TaxID=2569853 RepID=A0A6G2BKJ6_9ACTN|nr:DUF6011 domain-containing protein [Streptomyces taklimakanensis]MTE22599.1 hypothetical protein [Streptomyces taklimakanensis]